MRFLLFFLDHKCFQVERKAVRVGLAINKGCGVVEEEMEGGK